MEEFFHIIGHIGMWILNNADDLLEFIPEREEKQTLPSTFELNAMYKDAFGSEFKLPRYK